MTPPTRSQTNAQQGRSIPWPWALGSIIAVLLILGAALTTHAMVQRAREAAFALPAPAAPLLTVRAITRPEGGAKLVALDAHAGTLGVLAVAPATRGMAPQGCPPHMSGCTGAPSATQASAFLVIDEATGAVKARTALDGPCTPAREATALLADPTHGHTYALAGTTLLTFDSRTAACQGATAIETGNATDAHGHPTVGALAGAALVPNGGGLYLAYASAILLVDPSNGMLLRGGALPPHTAPLVAGPVLDVTQNTFYVFAQNAQGPRLAAFAADTLTPQGNLPLASGTHLGPMTPDGQHLILLGHDGTTSLLSVPDGHVGSAHPQPIHAWQDTAAVGWDDAQPLVATTGSAAEIRLLASSEMGATTQAILPLTLAPWVPWNPLLVDPARHISLLPAADGSLVVVQNTPTKALTQSQALLLAHAGLAHYLPPTNQEPPFVAPISFPLTATQADRAYYIHFSDLGWQGPYAGTASTSITGTSNASAEGASSVVTDAAHVTYTITWDQMFSRSHTWIVQVAPSGAVRLISTTGDAIP